MVSWYFKPSSWLGWMIGGKKLKSALKQGRWFVADEKGNKVNSLSSSSSPAGVEASASLIASNKMHSD